MEKNQLCQALQILSPVKLYFHQDNHSLFFDIFKIFFIQKCIFFSWDRSKIYVAFKLHYSVFNFFFNLPKSQSLVYDLQV